MFSMRNAIPIFILFNYGKYPLFSLMKNRLINQAILAQA